MRDPELIAAVRGALTAAGDPARAAAQQRYMRSAMPFRGLTSPELRALLRPLLADPAHLLRTRPSWERAVRVLWDEARYREERYAALAVARARPYRSWSTDASALALYRHLVETGAWWDLVDDVASHLLAPALRAHPGEAARMRAWAVNDHLWVRRAAILSQLGSRASTDTVLLRACVEANVEGTRYGREFFVRKAIGWALREYARTDPAWVRDAVDSLGDRLSPLSRREALKHLRSPAPPR